MTTPDGSESWIDPVFDAIVSEVQLTGYFDKVMQHEPKSAPHTGLTAAIWLQSLSPLPMKSGVAVTSGLAIYMIRIYSDMLKEPQDLIDPACMRAGANIIRRFHDGFDLGLHPLVYSVDLLGESGSQLSLDAGYVDIDNRKYRVMDITIPVILNDVWPQTVD